MDAFFTAETIKEAIVHQQSLVLMIRQEQVWKDSKHITGLGLLATRH